MVGFRACGVGVCCGGVLFLVLRWGFREVGWGMLLGFRMGLFLWVGEVFSVFFLGCEGGRGYIRGVGFDPGGGLGVVCVFVWGSLFLLGGGCLFFRFF